MDKFNSVQKSQVSWERIKPYLTEHKIKDNSSNINKGGVTLSVENLSFSYEEGKENIIEDISFEGKAGEIIGVTGSVASGKSTLGLSLFIQLTISGIKRVNNFYSETEDNLKKNELRVEDIIPNHKEVRLSFNNISFQYEEGPDVLENINLNLKPNEKVTFVGRTGVGKTTLFKLVMGLLKPTNGSITINGIDVYDIPNSEKRRIFGYVDQNFYMIKGTVADQITLEDESITKEQIENALDFVGLTEYVETLENGLDTKITSDTVVILENGRIKNVGSPEVLLENDDWYRSRLAFEKLTWS